MLKVLDGGKNGKPEEFRITLDELAREGARRMIATALQVEVEEYIALLAAERDEDGRACVVRNGFARPRKITLGAGTIAITAPRVNDRRVVDGVRQKFSSRFLRPTFADRQRSRRYCPCCICMGFRLVTSRKRYRSYSATMRLGYPRRQPSGSRIYGVRNTPRGVDGVHFNIRLEEEKLAALVIIGVRLDGTKEIVAIEDGYREGTESWLWLLRSLKARGMKEPVVAVGDGALGFWAAMRQVWPTTREQRCWFHKLGNVLDKLPKRLQPQGKRLLQEILLAATKKDAVKAVEGFS